MKFIILIISMFSSFILKANSIETTTIKIESKIFPKIALFEKNIKYKLEKHPLKIQIVYEDSTKKQAEIFYDEINKNYPNNKISNYDYILISNKIDKLTKSDIIIVVLNTKSLFDKLADFTKKQHILSFVQKESYLKYGFAISIHIRRKIIPSFNKNIIKEQFFDFPPPLLSISYIYSD